MISQVSSTPRVIPENDVCRQSMKFTLWLAIDCKRRRFGLVNVGIAEKRDENWCAGLLHQEQYRLLSELRVNMIGYEQSSEARSTRGSLSTSGSLGTCRQ